MNRWTLVTVVAVVLAVAAVVNVVWRPSWLGVLELPVAFVLSWWVVGGCARRGDPLARWLLHPGRWVHAGHEQ